MKIYCKYVREIASQYVGLEIDCAEVRHDLLIESIINDKGIDFVLNAIGCDDVLKYMVKESLG